MAAYRVAPERPPLPSADNNERGVALIEMAVVVGLLAMFLFGIITYGITMSFKQSMSQAANEAARAAAVAPTNPPTLPAQRGHEAANRVMAGHGSTCNGGDGLVCTFVTDPCPEDPARSCMTIRLVYDLRTHPRVASVPIIDQTLPDTIESTVVVEVNQP